MPETPHRVTPHLRARVTFQRNAQVAGSPYNTRDVIDMDRHLALMEEQNSDSEYRARYPALTSTPR